MRAYTCVYTVRVLVLFGIVTGTEWRTHMLVYCPLHVVLQHSANK